MAFDMGFVMLLLDVDVGRRGDFGGATRDLTPAAHDFIDVVVN